MNNSSSSEAVVPVISGATGTPAAVVEPLPVELMYAQEPSGVGGLIDEVMDDIPDEVISAGAPKVPAVLPEYFTSVSGAASMGPILVQRLRWVVFHAVRIPLYWSRLARRSPRPLAKGLLRVWQWVSDVNGRRFRRDLASTGSIGSTEAMAFHRISDQYRQRVKARLAFLLAALVVVPFAAVAAYSMAPGQTVGAAVAIFLAGTALAGWLAEDERPVTTSWHAASDTPIMSVDLVLAAIASLGIAGIARGLKNGPDAIRVVPPGCVRDGAGWRIELDLPLGVPATDVIAKREQLAASLLRPVSCVWPEGDPEGHAARLILWVADKPLAQRKVRPWALAQPEAEVDLFKPFPLGVDQRGRDVNVCLMFTSMIIGAVPRMGKTFTLRALLLAAGLDPRTHIYAYDLKGGADLRPLEAVAHRCVAGDEPEDLDMLASDVRTLIEEMRRRYKLVRSLPYEVCPEGKVTPELAGQTELGLHPIILALDECQIAFEADEAIEAGITDLVKRGPAVGIIVILATQRVDAKSIPTSISDNAVLRFALKVQGHQASNMVLGAGMYASGITSTAFTFSDKGLGWLVGAADAPTIMRTHYADAGAARVIAARARAARQARGLLTGQAAGITPEVPEPARGLLHDLLAVMPEHEPRAWSATLLTRLAEAWPARYATWDAAALGNALAKEGVATVQVWAENTNKKGVKRSDLQNALSTTESNQNPLDPAA